MYTRILARTHTHTANRSACQKVRTLVSIPSATFSRITSSVSLPEGAGYSAIQGIALPPREVFSELRALSKREEISPLSYLWQRLAWHLSLGPCYGKPYQGARRGIWTEFTFPFRQATLKYRHSSSKDAYLRESLGAWPSTSDTLAPISRVRAVCEPTSSHAHRDQIASAVTFEPIGPNSARKRVKDTTHATFESHASLERIHA